ncbi:MAG: aromatic amino acid transport family protein, partial [Desulfovibrionaceae bacterium]
MSRPSALRIVSASFLVTGNMVGAGILGLPIRTGLAGFWISVAALGGVWVLMLLSAMFLADRVLALGDPEADIPTLLAHALGPAGRWVILALSLFLYWTIMVAYLCGGTAILADLLGLTGSAWWVMLLFFLVLTLPVFFGLGLVQRCNAGLMAAMWLSFGALLALGAPQIRAARLEWAVWGLLPAAVPVMVGACVFHFVV